MKLKNIIYGMMCVAALGSCSDKMEYEHLSSLFVLNIILSKLLNHIRLFSFRQPVVEDEQQDIQDEQRYCDPFQHHSKCDQKEADVLRMTDVAVYARLHQFSLSSFHSPVLLVNLPPADQHQGNAQQGDYDPQIHPPQADILPQGMAP